LPSSSIVDELRAIRLRYSALTGYLFLLYSILTSLAYTVVILRRLSIEQYGLFTYSLAVTQVFPPFTSLWNTWVFRFYARKRYESLPTALLVNTVYALASSLFTWLALYLSEPNPIYSTLWSASVFISIANTYYYTILQCTRPYAATYVAVVSEGVRVLSAYLYVIAFKLGFSA